MGKFTTDISTSENLHKDNAIMKNFMVASKLAFGVAALLAIATNHAVAASAGNAVALVSPESQGVSSKAILKWIGRLEGEVDAIHAFVLMRHGKVIAEGDWSPYESLEVPHVLFSHSKSYTSTAIGLLWDEKKIDLDERVCDILKDKLPPVPPNENLRNLTVRHLLTMRTGTRRPHFIWGRPEVKDWAKAFLAEKGYPDRPGGAFRYDSDATYLLAEIVERKSGEKMMNYLRRKLFDPLGIESVSTTYSPTGVPCGGWGMKASARDNAKFGQLYLNEGLWNGRRILSREWVRMATSNQIETAGVQLGSESEGYGFQFWCGHHGTYRADGMLGQVTIVSPKGDFVLSLLSGTMGEFIYTFWQELLPAMSADALPEDPDALAALRARCETLKMRLPEGEKTSPNENEVLGAWKFNVKHLGIDSVRVEKTDTGWTLAYTDHLGRHEFPVGYGRWEQGKLRLSAQDEIDCIDPTPGEHPIAAAGAWKNGQLAIRTLFTTGPFRFNFLFRPEKDGVVDLLMYRIVPKEEQRNVKMRRLPQTHTN